MAQPSRSKLGRSHWRYVEKPDLDAFDVADWQIINSQRAPYMAEQQAKQVVRLLSASEDDPTFGYTINNYRHCLQSATMVMDAGYDEETIVVALLHDVGFIVCPTTHGEFAADLMAPYVSDANTWMLRHHALFQNHHVHGLANVDRNARERWRGHPHFAWTAEFVARFDQCAIRCEFEEKPLSAFVPLIERVFARPPRIQEST